MNAAETLLSIHLTEAGFQFETEVQFDAGCCGHPKQRHRIWADGHVCADCDRKAPMHDYRPTRRWRLDFVIRTPPIARSTGASYPATGDSSPMWLAIEVEGGGWSGGRHVTGKGFAGDLEKYQAALREGYVVARVSPDDVLTGRAIAFIREVLA